MTNIINNDPSQTQYVFGTDDYDIFEVGGPSSEYGFGKTQDGKGVVIWNLADTSKFDILYNVEEFQFTDKGYQYKDGEIIECDCNKPDGQNNAPVAQDDQVSGDAGSVLTVNPLANDTDADGDTLTVTQINGVDMQPGWSTWVNGVGLVTLNADNTVSIDPADGVTWGSVPYTVSDGNGGTATANINFDVNGGTPPTNTPPVAQDDQVSGDAGSVLTLNPLANDSDADGDTLTITQINGVDMQPGWSTWVNGVGLVTLNADNTVSIDPADGVTWGSVPYTVSDGNGGTATANINFDVNGGTPPANTPPVAQDDQVSGDAGSVLTLNPLANDTDADGDTLTITQINGVDMQPGWSTWVNGVGLVTLNADNTVSIDPIDGVTTGSVPYTISDGNGGTSIANINFNVNQGPGNRAPNAENDVATGDQDMPITGNVLGNDTDPDGDNLTVTGNTNPLNGTVTVNPDGTYTYTPNAGFVGNDSFTYTISDGNGGTDTATVNLTVDKPANSAPDAVNDTGTGEQNTPITGNVLGNDTDPDGDDLTVTGNTDPLNGTVTVNPDGTYTYTPNAGFVGNDTFTYTISDGNGGTDTATVTLTVEQPANQAPDAMDDTGTGEEGTPITGNVLGNDTDPDGDNLTVTDNTDPANGTVVVNADGTYTYTPNAGFVGNDTFTYTISDGNGGTDTATVTLTVEQPANQAPDAMDDTGTGEEGTPITGNVLGNDTDPDGDTLTVTDNTDPANGTVVVNTDGTYTYTPNAGFTGDDSFTYTISDGNGGTDTATVNLTVEAGPNCVQMELVEIGYSSSIGYTPDSKTAYTDFQYKDGVNENWVEERDETTASGSNATGDATINHAPEKSHYFRLILDEAVTEDTVFTVTVDEGTATFYPKTDVYTDSNSYWAGGEDYGNGRYMMSDARWNYNGEHTGGYGETAIVSQTFTVKAGTNYSDEYFWARFNGNGITDEGVEQFSFEIDQVSGDSNVVVKEEDWNIEQNDFNLMRETYELIESWTPIALDLNGDGEIGVTGETSSYQKDENAEIGHTVEFDIDADGEKEMIEWFDGSGDGILVDTTKIGEDGSIDGSALFGNDDGLFFNGYEKLALHDANGDGVISGEELEGLALWIDNGDAVLQEGELVDAAEYGVESISTDMQITFDEEGRELMQSEAQVNGETVLTEDVWFAEADDDLVATVEAETADILEYHPEEVFA